MQKIEIQAQPRTVIGRATKQLRKQEILPAVLYGNNFKSLNLQVPTKQFQKAYVMAGESTLGYVKVGDESYPAIIQDVAINPASNAPLHVDFYKVRLDEKIKAKIPLVFAGDAPAVKSFQGILVKNIHELEVEGFPQDLPHEFTIDLSILDVIGKQIMVKDIVIDSKLKLMAQPDEIVILVQAPISEEELKKQLETATAGTEDVEVIAKEKKEGEEGEAGETATPATAGAKKEEKK